ncbi:uncharacterized protein [Bemisia tabaci]|uniref:uncharacterized protein n=1 Tax=Bemisia tabaci TaxID=7038 RepID=UPI003B28224F
MHQETNASRMLPRTADTLRKVQTMNICGHLIERSPPEMRTAADGECAHAASGFRGLGLAFQRRCPDSTGGSCQVVNGCPKCVVFVSKCKLAACITGKPEKPVDLTTCVEGLNLSDI